MPSFWLITIFILLGIGAVFFGLALGNPSMTQTQLFITFWPLYLLMAGVGLAVSLLVSKEHH